MEALGSEVLKQIAEALLETLQCPVCLSVLRPPVTLCTYGHGLCPSCRPNMQICPTCREQFIDTKPVILHQLLNALPRDCEYKSLGCNEVYIPGGDHEKLCSYRTVDCKILECDWSGQARRLKDHVETSHEGLTVFLDHDVSADLSMENFNCSEDHFKYIPFVVEDQVFWAYVYMSQEVHKLCISFTLAPNGVSDFHYYAIVSLKNDKFEFKHSIKIPWDTSVGLFDVLEDHCMMIPQDMVARFITENGLSYSVLVIKEGK